MLPDGLNDNDPRLLQGAGMSSHELDQYTAVVEEQERRECEALKLYEPSPFQAEFHQCTAKERVIMAGNQVGKSLAGFIEDARCVLELDPYDKYPKGNGGFLVCLGLDEGHIGRNIYRYLFRAGAFQIIRDEVTDKWRCWKPWLPTDMKRKKECKPAPPLIPARQIKTTAWKKKAQKIFELVELHNGWTIYAMSSKGEPSAGFVADMCHIDEDIDRSDWYDEMIARLTMRDGKLTWTALPLARNDALVNVIERSEDEKNDENPTTVVFRATVYDNPYMPEDARTENVKRWKKRGDDEYRKRALGELVVDTIKMYPTFAKDIHCFGLTRKREDEHIAVKTLRDNAWEPPIDWTRYLAFDPGHTVGCILMVAVPPPKMIDDAAKEIDCKDIKIAYREYYIRNCDVTKFGEHMQLQKNFGFEKFIIDAHGGRLRELSSGALPRRQYELELQKRGVGCNKTDNRFSDGCSEVSYREMKLREWLSINESTGLPTILINVDLCPNLVREIERFKKLTAMINGQMVPIDKGNRRANTHAVETLEYLVADGLPYVKPKTRRRMTSIVKDILRGRKRRADHRKAQKHGGLPHISLGPQGDL